MPSKMKQTNIEPTGFVRRMLKKGASLKSLKSNGRSRESLLMGSSDRSASLRRFAGSEGSKWRPYKNQFERLDCEEDDDCLSGLSSSFQLENSHSSWDLEKSFPSAESGTGEHKRDIMVDQNAITLLKKSPNRSKNSIQGPKRGFSPLKPSNKDLSTLRAPPSATKKKHTKKTNTVLEWGKTMDFDENENTETCVDAFFNTTSAAAAPDVFSVKIQNNVGNNTTVKSSTAFRNEEESFDFRRTPSLHQPLSPYNAVTSFPTDFFSKEHTTKLTTSNLAKMDSTNNNMPDKTSSADGMERLVKEKKYYQFAIDEDKASTVVGSTIILPADYEDETEWSCSQNSQGTRIQQRSISTEAKPQPQVTQEDSENRKQSEPETVDGILSTSDHAKNHLDEPNEFDAFFPNKNTAVDDEEHKFDGFYPPNATSMDCMLPGVGASQNPTKLSTESDVSSALGDAYFERSYNGRTQDHQFYEASNKHFSYSPSPIHKKTPLPAFSENGRQPLSLKDVPSSASRVKMLATNFGTENKPRKDAVYGFDSFATRPLSQKRNESNGASNFKHPQSGPFAFRPDEATKKENIEMKSNRGDWVRNQNKQYQLTRNDDDEDDDDSFDDIAQWEKNLSSLGRGMREYPERISSVSRPALTNNAIMASMLFRTYHDIDQNDVQRKINQFEADNSKQKEIRHRHGDVPDAVDADLDHMTTVSSFSECTSAYMQESWRKPSRDLIHHFTSARALDLDYSSHRRLPIRQRVEEQQGLYEA